MIRLSKAQVVLLHKRLIETTGGSDGIRDEGMLDSALANPFQWRLPPGRGRYLNKRHPTVRLNPANTSKAR